MCNNEHCSAFADITHVLMDDVFGFVIQCACDFIEDEYSRIGNQCSSNSDALTLPPERFDPCSLTTVSYSSVSSKINSCAPESFAACTTRSIGMAGSASAIFSLTVRLNKKFSCRTTPMLCRNQTVSDPDLSPRIMIKTRSKTKV